MCFAPNVIRDGKFCGALKTYKNGAPNSFITSQIKSGQITLVPCGQCLQCRKQYAANWAARCTVEIPYHKESHFVTLTYDDEHVPIYNTIEDTTYKGIVNPIAYVEGKTVERMTLEKSDLQKFLKRLRKAAAKEGYDEGKSIKYFACGEYGGQTGRPHYHAIIYGLHIPDLKVRARKNGYEYDTSEWLQKIWGQGIVDIGGVSYQSCQYVAQYVVKKRKGKEAKFYEEAGINPEFVAMSLKPGIGYQYYLDHREEIYSLDKIYLSNGKIVKPPRYFDKAEDSLRMTKELKETDAEADVIPKMESDYMKNIKRERRKAANDALFAKLRQTNLTTVQYMDVQKKAWEANQTLTINRNKFE